MSFRDSLLVLEISLFQLSSLLFFYCKELDSSLPPLDLWRDLYFCCVVALLLEDILCFLLKFRNALVSWITAPGISWSCFQTNWKKKKLLPWFWQLDVMFDIYILVYWLSDHICNQAIGLVVNWWRKSRRTCTTFPKRGLWVCTYCNLTIKISSHCFSYFWVFKLLIFGPWSVDVCRWIKIKYVTFVAEKQLQGI